MTRQYTAIRSSVPRGLGKPLVPANQNAQSRPKKARGSIHLESGVSRTEIELLLVSSSVGDV
jgi:hypothetical protein